MFIGRWSRSAAKPECISALTARATARAALSSGHSFAAGNVSARYSQIARLSHTVSSLCLSAGTLPEGEKRSTVLRVAASLSGITSSSNAAPVCLSASHGRSDQDE